MITRNRVSGSGVASPAGRRALPRWVVVMLLPAVLGWALAGPACSDNNSKSKSSNKNINSSNTAGKQNNADKRMVLSSGEYNTGYQQGKRDAAASLIDANTSGWWTWMKEAQYRQGYNQGWSDGRQIKRLQAKMEEAKQQHQSRKEQQKTSTPKESTPRESTPKESKPQAPQTEQKQSSGANLLPAHKIKRVVASDANSKGQQ